MSNTLIVFALEVGDVVHITTKPTVLCSESRLPLNPTSSLSYIMPKIRRGTKPPPEGWELIEPTLVELGQKMRQAENEPSEAKRKVETSWPIMRLHHQRTRYIYDIYYRRKAISRDLYNYCIKEGHADAALIANLDMRNSAVYDACNPKTLILGRLVFAECQNSNSTIQKSLNVFIAGVVDVHLEAKIPRRNGERCAIALVL
ncbi:hypothetical protein BSLG_000754 [Batrachochytrium salamandrivorans]|nr:hypothetical protein BSLG_002441 [Batrachochytrium salamandrivorans]KAJ1345240.1 hypothetical protein BSLG_000754 [Batrachochytrium salamandrivorans]